MRLALEGEALPLWVTARRQTAGRGRAGRTWISDEGNLHASLAALSFAPLAAAGQLALVAGVALVEALCAISPLARTCGLRLKWPNDILIGAAKTGGILVESTTARGEPGFVAVIGFGLNLASHPGNLGRAATALADSGITVTPATVLASLSGEMESWLGRWDAGRNFSAIRQAWMERAGPIGETVRIQAATGPKSGTYQGLSDGGALLVECEGRLETITYGDVFLVANQDG